MNSSIVKIVLETLYFSRKPSHRLAFEGKCMGIGHLLSCLIIKTANVTITPFLSGLGSVLLQNTADESLFTEL